MTAPVLPAITPMPHQGGETASVTPSAIDTAADKRFSDVLSRKMTHDEEAENANELALGLPSLQDTTQTDAPQAVPNAVDLNAHILAQTHFLLQTQGDDAIATSDHSAAALSQISPITRRALGQTWHAVPHAIVSNAPDVRLSDANPSEHTPSMDDIGKLRKPGNTMGSSLMGGSKTRTGATSLAAQSTPTSSHAASLNAGHTSTIADALHTRDAAIEPLPDHAVDATVSHAHNGLTNNLLNLTQIATGHTANPSSSMPTTTTATIAVPLHHPQWSQTLGQQVLQLSQANAHGPQVAQLRLDPPELGPLHIAIELHQHVAHAAFVSAHAPVRLAVEDALPQLQAQLAQAGISLGQTSVSDQGAPQQEFTTRDATPLTVGHPSAQPQTERTASVATRERRAHALIDTFV